MEDQLLKRRLSTPRAATVVVLAAAVAVSVTVVPSVAQSFLTNQKAAKVYVTNKKASTLFLKKKAASNLYLAKATAPKPPVVGIAAGTAPFTANATTAGYIPTAFSSLATKAEVSSVVITFSGTGTCTATKPGPDQACPIQILVDGQTTGKVNFLPSTAVNPNAVPVANTIVQTTVLGKGGHTVAVQYAGAKNVTFGLKTWNLAVQAYPQPDEPLQTEETSKGGSKGGSK
ncbi:MAG TPA: hypothetical protein VNN15_02060 [Solirubrobacterales bacterium]|nr:hypothetical protein [Solirubrobacterales bacterium]